MFMKKSLLSLCTCLIGWSALAQDFNLSGTISNQFDGTPVSGQGVYVVADPSPTLPDSALWGGPGVYFFSDLITDFNGAYQVDIPGAAIPGTPLNIWILTDSCATQIVRSLSNNNGSLNAAAENFVQCHNGYQTCSATFSAIDSLHTGNLLFEAYNPSLGAVYSWDFGDGTTASGVDLIDPSHPFAPGIYDVTLNVYNFNIGCNATHTETIEIVSASCVADFIDVTPLDVIDTLYLMNNSSYSPTQVCTWDFGDGTILTGATPYHIYSGPGTYQICLTIDDGAGCTDTYCMTIVLLQMGTDGQRSGIPVIFLPVGGSAALGVDEELENLQMQVFPNPASDEINLSWTNELVGLTIVEIIDLTGRVIFSNTHTLSSGTQQISLELDDVTAGTYSVSIKHVESGVGSSMLFIKK